MGIDRSWRGVFAVGIWQITASTSYYAVFAATSSIRRAFDLSGFEIGLLVATLTLGYTAFLFPAGAFVDAYGDKPTMVLGLGGLGVGALGVSIAPSATWLFPTVFLLGGTYAAAMPATNRAIAERAPEGRYNLAINVKQVGVTGGGATAALLVTNMPVLGGTWQAAFAITGVVALGVVGSILVFYRNVGGTGSITVPDIRGLRGNRPYRLVAVAGFFVGASIFSTTGYLVPFFEDTGSGLQVAGIALASMQVAGSAGRVGVGGLADRLSTGTSRAGIRLMGGQLAVAGAMLAVLPVAPPGMRLPVVVVLGVGLLGLTGLFHGTLVALVSREKTGAATAGGQTVINLGGLVVPPLFGLLADQVGYRPGWWLLGALAFAGMGLLGMASRSVEPSHGG